MRNFKSGNMSKQEKKDHKEARKNRRNGRGKAWTIKSEVA